MKVISLGVGVQSTALYYMSSMGELPRADVAIFADTGAEKTATDEYYNFLMDWQKANNGIPIYKATYRNLRKDIETWSKDKSKRLASLPVFTSNGGKLLRQCTFEYKTWQVNKKIRKLHELKHMQRYPQCDIWLGFSLDEMQRIAIPKNKWQTFVYPLVGYQTTADGKCSKISDMVMRRGDLLNWYEKHSLPIPVRSSCVFCPFQSDKNWLYLKMNYPKDFQDAIEVDALIRDSSKRGVKEKIYVHRSLKPLSEVKFDENQQEFEECAGVCML